MRPKGGFLISGFLVPAATTLALICPTVAAAAPEEIQVYMDEMNAPGEIGLDVHNNYVLSGDRTPAYAGEQQSVHRYRITPEFSLGLSRAFELGGYLPLTTIDRDGTFRVQGLKLRLKYLVPRPLDSHWFYGLNSRSAGSHIHSTPIPIMQS